MVWNYYFKPVLAMGMDVSRAGSAVGVGSGARILPVASASSYFSEGDEIFICESDYSQVFYLGPATAVDASYVYTSLPVNQDYGSGYIVFTAEYFHQFSADYSLWESDIDSGIRNFRSSGGQILRTQVGEVVGTYMVEFRDMTPANWISFHTFYAGAMDLGLKDFFFQMWNPEINGVVAIVCRLLNERIPARIKNNQRLDFVFEFYMTSNSYSVTL